MSNVVVESAAVEMINKKIRNQRKRLVKIEKYESLDRATLNADQVETIARKAEVLGIIKELEGVLEAILATEKEARLQDLLHFVGKLHFACQLPVSNLVGAHCVSEAEFVTIMQLKKCFQATEGKSVEEFSTFVQSAYADLFNQSFNTFEGTALTFAETFDLIMRLLSPSPEPKFGMFEASRAAEPVKCAPAFDPPVKMPAYPSAINFLNPSCLDVMEPKVDVDSPTGKVQKHNYGKGGEKKKARKPKSQKNLVATSNDVAN